MPHHISGRQVLSPLHHPRYKRKTEEKDLPTCKRCSIPINPFSPNIHIQIWSPYISLKNWFKEFDKRSRHFLFGDRLIASHDLISCQCMEVISKKLILATLGTNSVNQYLEILGCFPFVTTDQRGHSRCNENFTFKQSYPARWVKS